MKILSKEFKELYQSGNYQWDKLQYLDNIEDEYYNNLFDSQIVNTCELDVVLFVNQKEYRGSSFYDVVQRYNKENKDKIWLLADLVTKQNHKLDVNLLVEIVAILGEFKTENFLQILVLGNEFIVIDEVAIEPMLPTIEDTDNIPNYIPTPTDNDNFSFTFDFPLELRKQLEQEHLEELDTEESLNINYR